MIKQAHHYFPRVLPLFRPSANALEVVDRASMADGGVTATATVANSTRYDLCGTNQGLTEINDHSSAYAWLVKILYQRQTNALYDWNY